MATVAILRESMVEDGERGSGAPRRKAGDEGRGKKRKNELLLSSFFSPL